MPVHDPNTIVAAVDVAPRLAAFVAAIVATLSAAFVAHTQGKK